MLTPEEITGRTLALWGSHPEIVAVWLFGSVAAGRANHLSDVDLAVLYRASPELLEHGRLCARAMSALGRNDVDVVDLRTATPFLQHRVLTRARLIYERDAVARVCFGAQALSRYFDLLPFLRMAYAS